MNTRYGYLLFCALFFISCKAGSPEDGIKILFEKGVLSKYLLGTQHSSWSSNLMFQCEGKAIEEFANAKSMEGFSEYLRFESSLAEEEVIKRVFMETRTACPYDPEKPLPFWHLPVEPKGDALLLRDALRTRLKAGVRYYWDKRHFERLLVVEPRRDGRVVFHLLKGRHYE